MNVFRARPFERVLLVVAIALLALVGLALAAAMGSGAQPIAITDVAPFRWA